MIIYTANILQIYYNNNIYTRKVAAYQKMQLRRSGVVGPLRFSEAGIARTCAVGAKIL